MTRRIFEYWPNAKFIQIIRDPRDVFASLKEAQKWDTPEEFTSLWSEMVGLINIKDSENFKSIRYEELILNTEPVMKDICKFLGLDWEPGLTSFKGKPSDFLKVKSATGKSSTTLKRLSSPMSSKRIGIWEKTLNKKELLQIEIILANKQLSEKFKSLAYEQKA